MMRWCAICFFLLSPVIFRETLTVMDRTSKFVNAIRLFWFWDKQDFLNTKECARVNQRHFGDKLVEGPETLVDRNILLYLHPTCTSAVNQTGNKIGHWISNPTDSESVSLAQNWAQDLHCNIGLRINKGKWGQDIQLCVECCNRIKSYRG